MPFSGIGYFFFTYGSSRHLIGLLGRGISPAPRPLPTHGTTQRRETQTHIHAPKRIRTCDPSVRAAEYSTCLRPLGDWDRLQTLSKDRNSYTVAEYYDYTSFRPKVYVSSNRKMKFSTLLRNVKQGLGISGTLWTRSWNFGFHKRRGISWVAEWLSASQEGFFCMELFKFRIAKWTQYSCI
jgi:hypothetical protein